MLLKDSDEGLTVYMAKRPGKGVFPDIYVFPAEKSMRLTGLRIFVTGCLISRPL